MRFNSEEHLAEYYKHGGFPKIHDAIYSMVPYAPGKAVMDLGCCFGLLSRRLAQKYDRVVGIEPNNDFLRKAIQCSRIFYYNVEVNKDTIQKITSLIQKHHVTVVFARRVFPEICDTGGIELCKTLAEALYKAGIEYIVIEGRVPTKKAVNPLWNIELECELFTKYRVIHRFKNCAVMWRGKA